MNDEALSRSGRRGKSQARYISGADVDTLIDLLLQFRDITLSQSAFATAASMIVELGGAEFLDLNARREQRE